MEWNVAKNHHSILTSIPSYQAWHKSSSYEGLRDYLHLRGHEAYLQKREIVEKEAPGSMKEAEKFLVLTNIDRLWKEHLQAIKFVQQAVSLRGYAQRDPVIEYKLEGYNLFVDMMARIRRNVIYCIYQEKEQKNRGRQKEVNLDANGNESDYNNPDPAISSSSVVGQEASRL